MEKNKSLDIQNSDLIQILKRALHEKSIQQATTDTHIRPVLQIVLPSRPIASAIASVNTNFYTVPVGKTLYITGANLSYTKSALATMSWISLAVQFSGATYHNLLMLRGITTTIGSDNIAEDFNPPIEIPAGSLIAIRMDADGAVINASACIIGYELDTK